MSAQDLADRCALLGMPIHRSVLANLENGRRPSVSVAELLVLATALEVPPILLALPLGHEDEIEILPGVAVNTWDAGRWWAGYRVARYVGDAGAAALFPDGDDEAALLYGHAHDEILYRLRTMHAGLERATVAMSELLGAEGSTSMLSQMTKSISDMIGKLRELRVSMRESGLTPPPLPSNLSFVDAESAL